MEITVQPIPSPPVAGDAGPQAIGLTPELQRRVDAAYVAAVAEAVATGRIAPDARPARVVEIHRESVVVDDGGGERSLRVLPSLRHLLADTVDALAVGDWVLTVADATGAAWVHTRIEPVAQLARYRRNGGDRVQRLVLVANVDTALLVMGLDLDFNVRRLERYLALTRGAAVQAVVVLTKKDLCADTSARLESARAVAGDGVAVVAVDATGDEPRRVLQPWLGAGRTLVALGSSGAGKSTLTNALCGAGVAATGAARVGDGRGRHTTTVRTLHRCVDGGCVIDTPGLRTLRIDADAAAVDATFADIAQLATACRFADCRHESEPGCAVRDGVAPERLRNFAKLQRESRRDTATVLERRARLAELKRGARARRRVASDRG